MEDAIYAVTQLAQTTMRSELGKITLDKTFEERESLNLNIVHAINNAAKPWGIEAMRYEIRKSTFPLDPLTPSTEMQLCRRHCASGQRQDCHGHAG